MWCKRQGKINGLRQEGRGEIASDWDEKRIQVGSTDLDEAKGKFLARKGTFSFWSLHASLFSFLPLKGLPLHSSKVT